MTALESDHNTGQPDFSTGFNSEPREHANAETYLVEHLPVSGSHDTVPVVTIDAFNEWLIKSHIVDKAGRIVSAIVRARKNFPEISELVYIDSKSSIDHHGLRADRLHELISLLKTNH